MLGNPHRPWNGSGRWYEARPKIFTKSYVGNSNNSYWLSDASNPLTGFPVVLGWMGPENQQQFLRTRITHLVIADRLAGNDELSETPLFDMDTLQRLMYANRVYGAEIALDDTLQICADYLKDESAEGSAADIAALTESCEVLARWGRRVNLDSRGAQVFTEYWAAIRDELGSDFQNVVISASLQEGGYENPRAGNSYIQTVTWDESDCPIADAILTHSQSVQPESDYYADQIWLYAGKRWVRFPFCEDDIVAGQVGETLIMQE